MIKVHDLKKSFGAFMAVDGVSFEVREGETFALLGPNGSGKSTILKCVAGLIKPTAGQISIGGVDLLKKPQAARRVLSFLPQRVGFHDCLTAREVLEFYCRLRKLPVSRIEDVVHGSEFNFNGFSEKRVSELSGGMKQKLGLAVACLADAPVLLLDEPTVSLDPAGAIAFRKFLRSLKEAGKTIVFTSHVLADVEMLADRVAVLVDGKLTALVTIEELRLRIDDKRLSLEEIYLDYAKRA
ncbi:MAG TPA: ABC transporter ATP-binding protein [Pyrinomonadaceae bacterium]|nr:ABC transporter ATP-binding protein [Pyrinomonadaceae bacterium]